jgi:hypothetical protein
MWRCVRRECGTAFNVATKGGILARDTLNVLHPSKQMGDNDIL